MLLSTRSSWIKNSKIWRSKVPEWRENDFFWKCQGTKIWWTNFGREKEENWNKNNWQKCPEPRNSVKYNEKIPNWWFLSRIFREPIIRNVLSWLSTDRCSAPSVVTAIICWKYKISLIPFNLTNSLSDINPVKIIKPSPCSQSNLPDPRHNDPRHGYNSASLVQ